MYKIPATLDNLLSDAETANLYYSLIVQTNKDFGLANEILDCPTGIFPFEFATIVQEKIYKLMLYKFDSYLNLLNIIDVSEADIKKLDGSDLLKLSDAVTFLILKREWQKVWYRANYS